MLLRYNSHICHVNIINALFRALRWSTCDTFFSKRGYLKWHLGTCTKRVKHIYPTNIYQHWETLLYESNAFKVPYRKGKNCFKNWQFLILIQTMLKNTQIWRQKVQSDRSLYRYQLVFRQIWSKNLFSFANPIPIIRSHPLLTLWMDCQVKARQGSDEVEIYWSWDSSQDEAVQNTGATQPKTQPSRNIDGLCRWLYRCLWVTRLIYPVPADAKDTVNWFAGTLLNVTVMCC